MTDKEIMQALLAGKVLQDMSEKFEVVLANDNLKLIWEEKEKPVCIPKSELFNHDWKIKREIININGFEVPASEKNPLEKDTPYYIPCLDESHFCLRNDWKEKPIDYNCLKRNLIHLNKESAIIHTKALLSLMQ